MNRPFLAALIIGVAIAGAIGALHFVGLMAQLEAPVRAFVTSRGTFAGNVAERWQYIVISM